jgi:hypothetical protein
MKILNMKNTIKTVIALLAIVVITSAPALADGTDTDDSSTIVNEFCTTVHTLYGSETRCDTETIDTGFVSAEILALSTVSFVIGGAALAINNYTKEQFGQLV